MPSSCLPPSSSFGLRSQPLHNIIVKQPYIQKDSFSQPKPPYTHYSTTDGPKKVFCEVNMLYWAKAFMKMTYDFIEHNLVKAKEPPPFKIPHIQFVEAGLVLVYAQTIKGLRGPRAGTMSIAYLAEEEIKSDEGFIKYIHNSDCTPIPEPHEPGYDIMLSLTNRARNGVVLTA
ncbi:hypothetical protein PAXRUDRAFT_160174 [Paxillus rubicundulus Ve08.2h10]|uniref:Unplaced genomic scaffold scaffold_1347, whole genome shotgun sequence n=1 Tax=Paxillus rubicundulus Ve08.2h10 TaxID=930991 RepID=A0A0D0D814_9AGAM|nr:hypothetical protein PAXRUDRAFT_160174 [Paxillus rubicundulus Ve08.2h10]